MESRINGKAFSRFGMPFCKSCGVPLAEFLPDSLPNDLPELEKFVIREQRAGVARLVDPGFLTPRLRPISRLRNLHFGRTATSPYSALLGFHSAAKHDNKQDRAA